MDSGDKSSDAPHIEVGSIFRWPNELRAAASKRFLEDNRGFAARNGGSRQKKYSISPAPPPWRKGREKQSREPLLRSEYVLIYGTRIIRRLRNGLIYCCTVTRTRGLFPFYTYILLLPAEMVCTTADQHQVNLHFSSVRVLTMWLLHTYQLRCI